MLFPEGMSYNRKIDERRIPRINEVFLQIAEQAYELTKIKNGNHTFVSLPSSFVRGRGRKSNYLSDFRQFYFLVWQNSLMSTAISDGFCTIIR